jgi:hypothetical protein
VRRPKDRDFVQTRDGFIWCLVGYLHPPDRYTAYLKYTPAASGRWGRGASRFRRELEYYHVRTVTATLDFLRAHAPHYLAFDPVQQLTFSFVPRDAVATYFRPEERLREIVLAPADPLEKDVEALVTLLCAHGGLRAEAFGITGSILLEIHDPSFSDIDLLVYGREAAARVREAVGRLRGGPLAAIRPERLDRWRDETARRFALSPGDILRLEARRWNYFEFRGRYVSVHPTRRDDEIGEEYGSVAYRPVGVATVEATVADASDSIFLPARYALGDVTVREGPPCDLRELISYEGLYCHAADAGDRIVARGMIEQIDQGPHRLVVGAAGVADGGYITLLRDPSDAARAAR